MLSQESYYQLVKTIYEANEQEPQNCDQVDLVELEYHSSRIANNLVEDYIQNVDLSKAQYNLDLLFEEAGRLGMDFGDLQQYGLESVKQSNCVGNTCISRKNIKAWDDALSKGQKFADRLAHEIGELYKRAQCHPTFRKEVTPRVQGCCSTQPFVLCTWPFCAFFEIPTAICCCCCECPYRCFFQWWWDIAWGVGEALCGLSLLGLVWCLGTSVTCIVGTFCGGTLVIGGISIGGLAASVTTLIGSFFLSIAWGFQQVAQVFTTTFALGTFFTSIVFLIDWVIHLIFACNWMI